MSLRHEALLLDCLRAERQECFGEKVAVNDRTPLSVNLPRAAGRVVPWAVGRAADLLGYAGRRPVRFGEAEPTPDERAVLNIIEALANGDETTARMQAEWLVKPAMQDTLLRTLRPAAEAIARA